MNEAYLLAQSLSGAALFAALYDRLGCVHAGHCGDTTKSHEKAHAGAVTATQVHTLLPDLSPMKGIHVDPIGPTARTQGGVTWAEYNRETQLHGLASTGGVIYHRRQRTDARWRAGVADRQTRPRD